VRFLVIRANEFLLLHQFPGNLPLELIEILRITLSENLKTPMPAPEIPNPVPPIADRLAIHFGCDVTFTRSQEPRPDSFRAKNISKLDPLAFSDPEPAVDDEPRR